MKALGNNKIAIFYILPAFLVIVCFVFIPIVYNLYNSMFSWSSFDASKTFVGFEYYKRLFTDPVFYTSLKDNSLYAVISLVFQVGLGLVIAGILEDKLIRRFQPFFRTVFFIPSVISLAVIGLVWQLLYNPEIGLVNAFFKFIGHAGWAHDWLGDSKTAMFAVIFVSQWQYTGYMVMLFLIAMQKIPAEYYEAALIDGASKVRTFLSITIPQIREMVLVGTVITVIGAFKVFDEVYVMTDGGPGRSTEVLGTMLYRAAFRNDEMGYASAIGTIIFIITLTLSLLQMKLGKSGQEV